MNSELKKYSRAILILFALVVNTALFAKSESKNLWKSIDAKSINKNKEREVMPTIFRALQLDVNGITTLLAQAPKENTVAFNQSLILNLPMPDGTTERFYIVETPVMHPDLAARYPQIKTYAGKGIDDAYAWLRLDITPLGFHAMIVGLQNTVFIDPVSNSETQNYLCYYKKDFPNVYHRHCDTEKNNRIENKISDALNVYANNTSLKIKTTGTQLKTYRLAMACTGEYAATKGGTVAGALAGVVTSVNRIDGIYEEELAVRMQLIANTNLLLYTNSTTDPYTNASNGTILYENQINTDNVIGNANYDFGHIFCTDDGGLSDFEAVCDDSIKAQSVTGQPNPLGDPFDVDYVAHEMGHEFGGSHTFNSNSGACNGNREPAHAYEPGSGSTIMAYAGICVPTDLQQHSDAIFHTESYREITTYITSGIGSTCASVSSTTNNPPIVNAGVDYTIPFKTPFILNGLGADPDGDAVTYCWEEFDRGSISAPNTPTGNAPSFRTFLPTANSYRIFPKLTSIIRNTTILGEVLPTYARIMNFRLTVRDNRLFGGGVNNNSITTKVTVINTTTPFQVTTPNVNSVLWHFGASEQVTWDVSSTDVAPINCSNVTILLSLDSGFTFPYTLATNTPNDGNELVQVADSDANLPNINTNKARLKIESVGNIFFDMSNAVFSIANPNSIESTDVLENTVQLSPNPGNGIFEIKMNNNLTGIILVTVTDCLGRIVFQENANKNATEFSHSINLDKENKGIYLVEVKSNNGKVVKRLVKL